MATVTHPQLIEILKELDATSAHATRLVESHDDHAFGRKPGPKSWSAAEAIAHLTISNERVVAEIQQALVNGDTAVVPDTKRYRMDAIGALLRWSQEPPYRMKAPTAPGFIPASVADRRTVLSQFLEQQRAVTNVIARAQGRNLSGIKITSPFNSRVHYNVFAALRVITTHNRRHLWQAEQALAKA
jgi:hypothetical protein